MAVLRVGSKCSSRRGGTARRPAFAENLHLTDRYEVPPSGGALNPNSIFEIGSSVSTYEGTRPLHNIQFCSRSRKAKI
jgi:hypothetical protein